MDAYVVIAEVTVSPDRLAEFIAHSLEDGRNSAVNEPLVSAIRRKPNNRWVAHGSVLRSL
jgi:hypothetical protein